MGETMMIKCDILIRSNKEIDPVTGRTIKQTNTYVNPYVENSNNKCPYFKKRFFAKKNEKTYCKDCKNEHHFEFWD